MPRYLTKSRFTLAAECPTKLYYTGKPDYVDRKQEDSFLAALADGGYQVGHLARLMHPGGVLVDEIDHDRALARTRELLAAEQVTVWSCPGFADRLALGSQAGSVAASVVVGAG